MSDRATVPTKDALRDFRQQTDEGVRTLEQRVQGSPNGLIVPGGKGGTWIPLAGFVNNWAATNIAGQQAPGYSLDADGFVHLRGHVRNTVAWTAAQNAALLPVAYAPKATESFVTAAASNGVPAIGTATWQIDPAGNLFFLGAQTAVWNATNWISLSGILYYIGAQ